MKTTAPLSPKGETNRSVPAPSPAPGNRGGCSIPVVLLGALLACLTTAMITLVVLILVGRTNPEILERMGILSMESITDKFPKCPDCNIDLSKQSVYPLVHALEQTLHIEGDIDRKEVMDMMKAKRHKIRECYAPELEKDHELKGEFGLQFTVFQTGKVEAAVELNTAFPNKKVKRCLLQEVKRWNFKKKITSQAVIRFDILMVPVASGSAF